VRAVGVRALQRFEGGEAHAPRLVGAAASRVVRAPIWIVRLLEHAPTCDAAQHEIAAGQVFINVVKKAVRIDAGATIFELDSLDPASHQGGVEPLHDRKFAAFGVNLDQINAIDAKLRQELVTGGHRDLDPVRRQRMSRAQSIAHRQTGRHHLTTIAHTVRKQKRNVLAFLAECCQAFRGKGKRLAGLKSCIATRRRRTSTARVNRVSPATRSARRPSARFRAGGSQHSRRAWTFLKCGYERPAVYGFTVKYLPL
jgi:hypothetical protein